MVLSALWSLHTQCKPNIRMHNLSQGIPTAIICRLRDTCNSSWHPSRWRPETSWDLVFVRVLRGPGLTGESVCCHCYVPSILCLSFNDCKIIKIDLPFSVTYLCALWWYMLHLQKLHYMWSFFVLLSILYFLPQQDLS